MSLRQALAALLVSIVSTGATADQTDLLGGLHWRLIGPFRGGRALAVTGVPGKPEKFYFGAVGGGVWQSENAGRTWKPIFDSQPVASIGWITVAPSNPNVIYVGSGEADMRSDIQQGNGMYKSTDGGKSWTQIGLTDSRQIGKILVDPQDPNTVYVAALGHQYGPNSERGVYKSTDGGATWTHALDKGPNVGAIDLAMDPSNASIIYAAMWHTRRAPWSVYPPAEGDGNALYKSTDAGKTWSMLGGHGFPAKVGRIGIAVSPARPERVYACVDASTKEGGIYRSDDGGASWIHTDGEPRVWGRGWYFAGVTADPKDADTVYVMNTSAYRSTDGGKTFKAFKGAPGGDDYHTLWIDPNDSDRMILGCDQGVVVSVDHGRTWSTWYNQPTGQFYHVVTDERFPYWVYGSQQDSGAMALPSRTIHSGISMMDTRPIDAGGESGTIAPDPLRPGMLYSSSGSVEQLETAWNHNIDPTLGHWEEPWRNEWTMPIVVSPADPRVVYTSHQKVFRSDNGGDTWSIISPDLTRKKLTNPPNLDAAGLADNEGIARPGVVYWLAPSPVKAGLLWAGTDDGLLWVTDDDGKHWRDVSPPGLTSWSKVAVVDAGHFDANTAYAAIDRHRLDDNQPYIYRTHDHGKHWRLITSGIPQSQFVNVVREDPKRAGLLYAGTDWGIYVSFDDGGHWRSLQLDLPAASVRDIVFGGNDVVVGTHGRAIWALDDVSRFRQPRPTNSTAWLFKPGAAYLFQRAGVWGFGVNDEGTPLPPEEPQGENPAWGAALDYACSGTDPVVLNIYDSRYRLIRRITSNQSSPPVDVDSLEIPAYWVKPPPRLSASHGTHRFVWDLRYKDESGPVVPPGTYTVRLTVGSHYTVQNLEVRRDPRIPATDADLQSQFDFILGVRAEVETARVEWTQAQAAFAKHSASWTAKKRARLAAIVNGVHSLKTLAEHMGAVASAAGGGAAAPTTNERETFALLRAAAEAQMAELKRFGL